MSSFAVAMLNISIYQKINEIEIRIRIFLDQNNIEIEPYENYV